MDRFTAFKDHVISCNTPNGTPRYLDKGYQSAIEVITYAEYQRLSVAEAQAKFRLRHLLITDVPSELEEPIQFDEAGLQELTNWDSKIHIHGKSYGINHERITIYILQTNLFLSKTI
jgi:hypothetical protein